MPDNSNPSLEQGSSSEELAPTTDAIANVRRKAQAVATKQKAARGARHVILWVIVAVLVIAAAIYVIREVEPALETREETVPASAVDDGFRVSLPAVDGAATPEIEDTEGGEGEIAAPAETEPPAENASEPLDVQVFLDYKSAASAQFQLENNTQLEQWLRQDAISLTYHPVVLLTPAGDGAQYAQRAGSALACVAEHSPEQLFKYNQELLLAQPKGNAAAPTDEDLFTLAVAVGAQNFDELEACITTKQYADWVNSASTRAIAGPLAGIEGTALVRVPMIFVNGQQYLGPVEDDVQFAQFVLGILSTEYFDVAETPTPEPSATETPAPETPTPSASETPTPEPTATEAPAEG